MNKLAHGLPEALVTFPWTRVPMSAHFQRLIMAQHGFAEQRSPLLIAVRSVHATHFLVYLPPLQACTFLQLKSRRAHAGAQALEFLIQWTAALAL